MALKLGIILWTLHLCSHCFRLFWMILLNNAMGRKFHHNYSNYSQSEATNQRYRCNPLWREQLGSGKASSSNSSSTTSRTSRTSFSSSSSSSSDNTRQGKTIHVFPAILWRYPKMEKEPLATNPPHHFNTTTSPNFKRGKPNTIQFPMELTH